MLDLIKLILEYSVKLSKPVGDLIESKKLGYSKNDIEILRFFYPCFDRLAFRISFHYENLPDLVRALDDTTLALTVGIRRTREGEIIARGKGKSELEDASLRARFDAVVLILWNLRYQFDIAVATRAVVIGPDGVFTAAVPELVRLFDDSRNEILKIVNEPFKRIGKQPFPRIESSSRWVHSGTSVSKLPPRIHEFYSKHLGREAPLFPAECDQEQLGMLGASTASSRLDAINSFVKELENYDTSEEALEPVIQFVLKWDLPLEDIERFLVIYQKHHTSDIPDKDLRKRARELMESHPIVQEMLEHVTVIRICHGLSLSEVYWSTSENDELTDSD